MSKRASSTKNESKKVKLSPRALYNQKRETERVEKEEFKNQLSILNVGDNLSALFSEKTLFEFVSSYLHFDHCVKLQQLSKTWYLIFNHRDFMLWGKLHELGMNGRYGYMNIAARTRLKPSNFCYLNQWGLSLCNHCLMYAGRTNSVVSVFEQRDQSYFCINPKCARELDGTIDSLDKRMLFDTCVTTSRRAEKSHTWKELKVDLRTPDSEAIDISYEYCTRCGVLRQETGLYNEDDYCRYCNHSKSMCPKYSKKYRLWLRNRKHKNAPQASKEYADYLRYRPYRKIVSCQKCVFCFQMPNECLCVKCLECTMCQGCSRCTDSNKLCQCVFCEDCDKLVECNKRYRAKLAFCECEDEF